MIITARQPVETTVVAVATGGRLPLPEPGAVFALFPNGAAGATYFDDPALGVRSFLIAHEKVRIIFERMRMRIEDIGARHIEDLPLGELAAEIATKLYPQNTFNRYGFNYDVTYRYDQVLPTRGVLGAFLSEDLVEDVSHFGWQCTLTKDKGKRRETYFFKVISPLELQVLANFEFDRPLPESAHLQLELQRGYADSQAILNHLTLTV